MARQRIHNRRASRGAQGGASWISYSDMMAALLLIFVLILAYSLYQYFSMLETKTKELETQSAALRLAETQLDEKEQRLIIVQKDLEEMQDTLSAKEEQLNATQAILIVREEELESAKAALAVREKELESTRAQLEEQQAALNAQQRQIDDLIGLRTTMIRELSTSLSSASLKATVDPVTGAIVLDSSIFFETGKSTIKEEGKALLDRFIPVYLDVLLQPKYENYLGEIIIEGHTDSSGDYESNLKLSQARALEVAMYILKMPSLRPDQRTRLEKILTAKGRSESDLVLNPDGTENPDASRRVEFKFSLKDLKMIEDMNKILSEEDAP